MYNQKSKKRKTPEAEIIDSNKKLSIGFKRKQANGQEWV
jgi:hypothetical protein